MKRYSEMTHVKERPDAITHDGRDYVPTKYGETQWVQTLAEFRHAGGTMVFNEDQTEIYLTLPAGWKFGIKFGERQP